MAEGGALLRRYTGLNLYRGFESLSLRHVSARWALVLAAAMFGGWQSIDAAAATATLSDVITAVRHMQARQREADEKYERLVGTLHVGQWMSIAPVLDRKLRAEYRTEVTRAQQGLRAYAQETARLRDQVKRYVEDVSTMGAEGAAFKRGYDRTSDSGEQMSRDTLANETDIYALVIRFYDFLDDPAIRYQTTQTQILFESEANLKRYKAFFAELKTLSARAEELQQMAVKKRAEAEEKMKAATKESARTGK